MSEFSGRLSHAQRRFHGSVGCAEVIAEVWTCSTVNAPGGQAEAAAAPRGVPGCFKHYGLEERIKELVEPSAEVRRPRGTEERLRLEIARPPSSVSQ